jgi:hypothetical protein
MNRIFVVLAVLLCTTGTLSLAQVFTDEKIITFDKLSKTVIPFVASAQPTVTTEPSLEGQYTLAFADGKGTITFAKPVPKGSYKVRFSANGKTAETVWNVLPTSIDARSMRSLASMKLFYGKRLSLRSRLPAEAELPLQQFKIDYQFGSEAPSENNLYSESWVGPNIPASAKTVKVSIVWKYSMTGERVTLFTKELKPEQTSPDIDYWNSGTELTKYDAPTNTYFIAIRGIGVDYEVPLDADNSDANASKSIKATLADVKAEPASLDYNAGEFVLKVYRDNEPVKESSWTPNPSTFKIVKGGYDSARGAFPITIAISGLPPSGTELRGSIAIRAQAMLVNRKAGIHSLSYSPPCIVPLTLPINTHLTENERTAAMQLVAKSYVPTTTKTVRLAGSEFLKRQYWLSSRLRNQDFSLFTANEATILTVRNIISSPPLRTPELEFAEKQCTTTDDIKRRFSKKLPIPQAMIDEGGDPAACETVKQFYSQVMSYEAVSHVVMLVSKLKGDKTAELLGALALGGRDKLIIRDTDIAAPLHIYSLEDLKALRIDGSTTLYDMLAEQLTNLDAGLLERMLTVETTEVVPVPSKGSTLKKGK